MTHKKKRGSAKASPLYCVLRALTDQAIGESGAAIAFRSDYFQMAWPLASLISAAQTLRIWLVTSSGSAT